VDEQNEAAKQPDEEYAEERFAELAQFLFARTDPLLPNRPEDPETDRAVQALNNAVRALLGQARVHREWGNEPALASTWPAFSAAGPTAQSGRAQLHRRTRGVRLRPEHPRGRGVFRSTKAGCCLRACPPRRRGGAPHELRAADALSYTSPILFWLIALIWLLLATSCTLTRPT
jgi:hypothetical protein